MMYSDVPRTLVYKDVIDVNHFLGNVSERTLEREFYGRLYTRQFLKSSDDPLSCALTIFNNARYIYYLIKVEENSTTGMLDTCIAKAYECGAESSRKEHIAAATMALVYSWLENDLRKLRSHHQLLKKYPNILPDEEGEGHIMDLCEDIYIHYSDTTGSIPDDVISDFHYLIVKESDKHPDNCMKPKEESVMPSVIKTLFEEILDPEEAASGAPIQDAAKGIGYLINCFNAESESDHVRFLHKLLKRLDTEKASESAKKDIEIARATTARELAELESIHKPDLDDRYSVDSIDIQAIKSYPDIDPDIKPYTGWIHDSDQQPRILYTLKKCMERKTHPKGILMPLAAALKAGVIRKPTWSEYKKVFEDHPLSTGTSLSFWVNESKIYIYETDKSMRDEFLSLVRNFTKIKENTF